MFLLFLKDVTRPCAILGVHCTLETRTWNTGPGNKTVWSTAPLGCGRACVCVCVCVGGVCLCGWVGVSVCCQLEHCVSSFHMALRFSSPRDLVKRQILIQGPRFCIFSKFPSDASASGRWTTLRTIGGRS